MNEWADIKNITSRLNTDGLHLIVDWSVVLTISKYSENLEKLAPMQVTYMCQFHHHCAKFDEIET